MKEITIGQFFPGKSPIHRVDPRAKLVLLVTFLVSLFLCRNFFSLGLMVLALAIFIALSRIPVRLFVRGLRAILFLIVFTSVINMLYVPGHALAHFWIFQITREGVETAVFMVARVIALLFAGSLLTYTTSPTMLTDAMERLLSPLRLLKIEVHAIAMMMTIALRFIPTIIEEIDKIMNAQKARGAQLESRNLIQRVRAFVPILVPLFVSAFRRAYELATAMECRCYRGGGGRTRMKQLRLTMLDYAAFAIVAMLLAGVICGNTFVHFASIA